MHDDSTMRPDTACPIHTPGKDHRICVSTVDSHGCRERGYGESSEYQHAHAWSQLGLI